MIEFPTTDEREVFEKYLSTPMKFPGEFKAWLTDWLALNIPFIPVSQIMGYKGTLANNEIILTEESHSSPERTWVDLATVGPAVRGLADGVYWVAWGGQIGRVAGQADSRIGVSINGATPTKYVSFVTNEQTIFAWRAASFALANKDNNEVSLKYWVDLPFGGGGWWANRWITVLRIT